MLTVLFIILIIHAKPHSFSSSYSSSLNQSTSTGQFGFLNVIPICHSFSLHQSRPFVVLSPRRLLFYWVSFSLETSNSTHGPVSNNFNVCTLNIRPLLNPMKFTATFDLAQSGNVDLFALTETWITSSATSAKLRNATPPGFSLISRAGFTLRGALRHDVVGGPLHFFPT